MIKSVPKNITVAGQTINVKKLLCYLAIIYLMSIFYRCIRRSSFSVVGSDVSKASSPSYDCYGQPGNFRGNLPGAYSNVPRDIDDKFFSRFDRSGGMDENRF